MNTLRNVALRRAAWHSSAVNYDNTAHLITDGIIDSIFDSTWISKGNGEEWVYIDLGTASDLTSVIVYWGKQYATDYSIQTSLDAMNWNTIKKEAGRASSPVASEISGNNTRYLRILCNTSSGNNYMIKEVEVYGTNDYTYQLPPMPEPANDGIWPLTDGNWRVQRASEVDSDGFTLSLDNYDDSDWLPASVPDTILVSYLKAGAIPNPNYDDWQNQVSDSFFTADFWYRNHFPIPSSKKGQEVMLNFNAINWKADIYFNGHMLPNQDPDRLKSIEGAFIRGMFNITEYVNYDSENYLAVYIYKNNTPEFGHMIDDPNGPKFSNSIEAGEKIMVSTQGLAEGPWNNGGRLGLDNPTFHAAIGWDWLPTIRGRDIGIYNDVYLSFHQGVELKDPWVETHLNITETSGNLTAVNLAKEAAVDKSEWTKDASIGSSFTIDLGADTPVGSVTINWDEVPDTAAYESQNAKKFRLESSIDGVVWNNFDAYPGSTVEHKLLGKINIEATAGTDEFDGFNDSNTINGPHTTLHLDLRSKDWGVHHIPDHESVPIRYLRFTVTELMKSINSSHGVLPPKIKDFLVYAASAEEVGQSMIRTYHLDDSKAELTFRTEVCNHRSTPIKATINGLITPGNLAFSKTITITAGTTQTIKIPDIMLHQPNLWWPNTYGDPFLYTANVQIVVEDIITDKKQFRFGVREFTYPIDGNRLTLYCNGLRIVAKGGNWGMDDGLKLDRTEDYYNKARLTADENLVMIRNWVGQTNNKAFYDACDEYGLLIWDDFWLANPADGPDPADEDMFLHNVVDKIKQYRSHASLALYCGRNEAMPPESLDIRMKELTEKYDGTRYYIPNSAGAPVGSGGGYSLRDPIQYFNDVPAVTLRSEMGIPNVPEYESIQKFLSEKNQWPISEAWALHDFTFYMNGPANSSIAALTSYQALDVNIVKNPRQKWGPSPALTAHNDPEFLAYKDSIYTMVNALAKELSLKEFTRIAQMINFEHHRALFEGLSVQRSNGALMWMSQSSFPSFMWQTYDYFLATNAGYFGVKAGNQPTHAVIDPRTNEIILANATSHSYTNVVTTYQLYDLSGTEVLTKSYTTETLGPDSYGLILDNADYSASTTDIIFIRLTVADSSNKVLGENLYWYNRSEYMNYQALNDLATVKLTASVRQKGKLPSGNEQFSVMLKNESSTPALLARVRVVDNTTGEDVLPTFYDNNYVSLMPNDTKIITMDFHPRYLKGHSPAFYLSGWNITEDEIYPF